jgi:crotonobetaine/carnitine-CoA ligase
MLLHEDHVSPFAGYDLAAWLTELARWRGAHPVLIWSPFDGPARVWSYERFAHEVACLAGGLARRGIAPGDRILVHLENCPEMLLARFACAWIGAVCVGTNAHAAGPELTWYAASTGAVAAITQPKFATLVETHCSGLKWVAVTADDAGTPPGPGSAPARAERFEALFAEPLARRAPDPFAPCSIMFTTGTTSRPKGVVWTHANVLWGARLNAAQQRLLATDLTQVFLPMYHVVGLSWCATATMWAGGTVLLQPRFSASGFWPAALQHGATVAGQVFFTLKALAGEVPRHRFRTWVVARHEPAQMQHFGVDFIAGWGMTEVLTQAIVCEPGLEAPAGAIGRPSSGYRIRIVDEEGRQVRPGEAGHLLVGGLRGLSLFREYDGQAEATAEAFDADGYFRTGDRVILRPDGWLQFGDRIKDVLKVGGEGVSASEIEAVILRTGRVSEVAVVARSDADYGEVPVAFVVPKPDLPSDDVEALVLGACRASLAKFKVPREVRVLHELPTVGFGKVSKARLREMLAQD